MVTTEGEYSPKRQYDRRKAKKNCILRINCAGKEGREALFVETLDHSKGGLSIVCNSEKLSVSKRVFVYIENLKISGKEAKVVWLKPLNGCWAVGLQWV